MERSIFTALMGGLLGITTLGGLAFLGARLTCRSRFSS